MSRRTPGSTRTETLLPVTTRFRAKIDEVALNGSTRRVHLTPRICAAVIRLGFVLVEKGVVVGTIETQRLLLTGLHEMVKTLPPGKIIVNSREAHAQLK